jgi:hypothetical protein
MKSITERPDLVLTDDFFTDKLMFTIRDKTVVITCHIDNTGNAWEVPIKTLKGLLHKNDKRRKVNNN